MVLGSCYWNFTPPTEPYADSALHMERRARLIESTAWKESVRIDSVRDIVITKTALPRVLSYCSRIALVLGIWEKEMCLRVHAITCSATGVGCLQYHVRQISQTDDECRW